jgi:hypothetical protein
MIVRRNAHGYILTALILLLVTSSLLLIACDKKETTSTEEVISTESAQQDVNISDESSEMVTQESTCDMFTSSYNIPLSIRKSEKKQNEIGQYSVPTPQHAQDVSTIEWCYSHTPEALPTMRQYFEREMNANGWSVVERFDEVESSESYWERSDKGVGAMVWLIPDEPGTFIAIAVYR